MDVRLHQPMEKPRKPAYFNRKLQMQMDHAAYQKSLQTKSLDALKYIIMDCKEALIANPTACKAGYYADEICYAGGELRRRELKPMSMSMRRR